MTVVIVSCQCHLLFLGVCHLLVYHLPSVSAVSVSSIHAEVFRRYLESVLFCQYFDTVGWVFWPVKTVARITYTVLVETLNHAQSIIWVCVSSIQLISCLVYIGLPHVTLSWQLCLIDIKYKYWQFEWLILLAVWKSGDCTEICGCEGLIWQRKQVVVIRPRLPLTRWSNHSVIQTISSKSWSFRLFCITIYMLCFSCSTAALLTKVFCSLISFTKLKFLVFVQNRDRVRMEDSEELTHDLLNC